MTTEKEVSEQSQYASSNMAKKYQPEQAEAATTTTTTTNNTTTGATATTSTTTTPTTTTNNYHVLPYGTMRSNQSTAACTTNSNTTPVRVDDCLPNNLFSPEPVVEQLSPAQNNSDVVTNENSVPVSENSENQFATNNMPPSRDCPGVQATARGHSASDNINIGSGAAAAGTDNGATFNRAAVGLRQQQMIMRPQPITTTQMGTNTIRFTNPEQSSVVGGIVSHSGSVTQGATTNNGMNMHQQAGHGPAMTGQIRTANNMMTPGVASITTNSTGAAANNIMNNNAAMMQNGQIVNNGQPEQKRFNDPKEMARYHYTKRQAKKLSEKTGLPEEICLQRIKNELRLQAETKKRGFNFQGSRSGSHQGSPPMGMQPMTAARPCPSPMMIPTPQQMRTTNAPAYHAQHHMPSGAGQLFPVGSPSHFPAPSFYHQDQRPQYMTTNTTAAQAQQQQQTAGQYHPSSAQPMMLQPTANNTRSPPAHLLDFEQQQRMNAQQQNQQMNNFRGVQNNNMQQQMRNMSPSINVSPGNNNMTYTTYAPMATNNHGAAPMSNNMAQSNFTTDAPSNNFMSPPPSGVPSPTMSQAIQTRERQYTPQGQYSPISYHQTYSPSTPPNNAVPFPQGQMMVDSMPISPTTNNVSGLNPTVFQAGTNNYAPGQQATMFRHQGNRQQCNSTDDQQQQMVSGFIMNGF